MTKITISVVDINHRDIGPYKAGMAEVFLDGKLIAKLRTEESIELEVTPTVATRLQTP